MVVREPGGKRSWSRARLTQRWASEALPALMTERLVNEPSGRTVVVTQTAAVE